MNNQLAVQISDKLFDNDVAEDVTIKVMAYCARVKEAVEESKKIVLVDESLVQECSHYTANFKKMRSDIEELRESVTKPILEQKRQVDGVFKLISSPIEEETLRLQGLLTAHMRKLKEDAERKAREERQRLEEEALKQAIEKEAKLKQRAELLGANLEEVKVEVAIVPEVVVEKPKLSSQNTYGIRTVRTKKWRITDFNLIPRQLLTVDEKKMNNYRNSEAFEAKSDVPGIEFYYEENAR
jgi:hypothetical protein